MTPLCLLKKIDALYSHEAAWDQYRRAAVRDAHGNPTSRIFGTSFDKPDIVLEPRSPQATCWCLSGAIQKLSGNTPQASKVERRVRQILLVPKVRPKKAVLVRAAGTEDDPFKLEKARDANNRIIYADNLEYINDHPDTSFADIKAWLKRAIAFAEKAAA